MARSRDYRRALAVLRERRRSSGRAEKELAAAVGISGTFLRTLERGATTASPDVQSKLASELGVVIDALFAPAESLDCVGVNEASRESGVHRKTIRKALRSGELRGEPPTQHTDAWKIKRADVKAWAAALDARRSPVRDHLLVELAPCGCPACDDPACEIVPGRCHRDDCEQPATIAAETSARQRAVEDMPTLYCSGGCSLLALDENPMQALSSEYRDWLDREGLVDVETAAKRLDRSRAVIERFALIHELGQRFPGFHWNGAWAFSEHDLERLREIIEATPRGELHRDPDRRKAWYVEAAKSHGWSADTRRRFHGHLAGSRQPGVLARPRGRERLVLKPEVIAEIRRLHDGLGWGRPAIAERVRLSEHLVRRVLDE